MKNIDIILKFIYIHYLQSINSSATPTFNGEQDPTPRPNSILNTPSSLTTSVAPSLERDRSTHDVPIYKLIIPPSSSTITISIYPDKIIKTELESHEL